MIPAAPEKQAVILSGGGAYGAYEVGVLKALTTGESASTGHQPLRAEIFAGTSVGSFNAAAMAMQPGVDPALSAAWLEKIWLESIVSSSARCGNGVFRFRGYPIEYADTECLMAQPLGPVRTFSDDSIFFGGDIFRRGLTFLFGSGNLANRLIQIVDLSSFISIQPFRSMIKSTISLSGIRNSDRHLRIAVTNWESGLLAIFENQHFIDSTGGDVIMASAAIPGIFPPVKIGETTYVDGGVVMNTPLRLGVDAGASVLHVVYMDPDVRLLPWRRMQSTLDTMGRMYTIMLATSMNEDIKTAIWVNEGLAALRRVSYGQDLSEKELRSLVRVAGQFEKYKLQGKTYRPLTIHRYHPRDDLGGMLGMLNFSDASIRGFIHRGFFDAVAHDCIESGCVLPGNGDLYA